MKKFTLLLLSLVFALSTIALAACKHEHEFSESWIAGDTSHYYVCECGEKKDEASHVFDNACDTTCNTCGKTRSTSHSYASTLTAGDTTHYYACGTCGDKKDEAAHVFAQVKSDTTLVSQTDTTATYKKSCTCGKLSNETFTVEKTVSTLSINVEDKVYDGQPIQVTYDTNSNGAVTIEYKRADQDDSHYTTTAPNYSKEFIVRVSVAGTREYTPITSTETFTISQKELTGTVNLNLEYGDLEEYNTYHIYEFILEGTEYGLVEGEKVKIRVIHMSSDGIVVGSDSTRAQVKHWLGDEYVLNYQKGTLVVNSVVVAKEIEIEHEFTLVSGQTEYEYTLTEADGAVYGETVVLKVVFESAEAGAGIVSKKLYVGGVEATNYVLSTGTTLWLVDISSCNSFANALTFDCQTAQSYTANMVAGQKVYIKINGAGGTLNDFFFQATTGSTATYTFGFYSINDTTAPYRGETTADPHVIYQDINDTDDMYLVVTCVTAGEVSITSAA